MTPLLRNVNSTIRLLPKVLTLSTPPPGHHRRSSTLYSYVVLCFVKTNLAFGFRFSLSLGFRDGHSETFSGCETRKLYCIFLEFIYIDPYLISSFGVSHEKAYFYSSIFGARLFGFTDGTFY